MKVSMMRGMKISKSKRRTRNLSWRILRMKRRKSQSQRKNWNSIILSLQCWRSQSLKIPFRILTNKEGHLIILQPISQTLMKLMTETTLKTNPLMLVRQLTSKTKTYSKTITLLLLAMKEMKSVSKSQSLHQLRVLEITLKLRLERKSLWKLIRFFKTL